MKIALDVMGGDHGLAPAIEGALQAVQECDVEVLLVGDEAMVTAECRRLGCTDPRLSIRHASQVVEMHESPATVAILASLAVNCQLIFSFLLFLLCSQA